MDVAEVEENLFSAGDAKLHGEMCRKLSAIVSRVLGIFPVLEGTRPGSKAGIHALCALHVALDRAKNLLQHCSESSKLYLAVTGDSVLMKFEKARGSLEESLRRVEEIVPESIGLQIVEIVSELEKTVFELDALDKEAGDEAVQLLQRRDSGGGDAAETEVFHRVVSRLGIASSRAALTERRALKKLIDKARAEDDRRKESVLAYLLHLMRKHPKLFRGEVAAGDDTDSPGSAGPCSPTVLGGFSSDDGCASGAFERGLSKLGSFNFRRSGLRPASGATATPPEELRCPISLQLMHDPVVISSGQTYERACIEKWFADGRRTCPKTQQELSQLTLTPNYCVKGLIAGWCEQNGVPVPDAPDADKRAVDEVDRSSPEPEPMDWHALLEVLNGEDKAGEQHKQQAVERLRILLKDDEEARVYMGANGFLDALLRFLSSAVRRRDRAAQEAGAMALFNLAVKNNRNKEMMISAGVLSLLEEMIGEPETHEPAAALYLNLSCLDDAKPIISSGPAAAFLAGTLRSATASRPARHDALYALYNLSTHPSSASDLLSAGAVGSLQAILTGSATSPSASWTEKALAVLINLSSTDEGRREVAASPGMAAGLAEALDSGGPAEQEQAAACLLLLCDGDGDCCHVVLQEGVIPALVSICANGTARGKEKAMMLLKLFREQRQPDTSPSPPPPLPPAPRSPRCRPVAAAPNLSPAPEPLPETNEAMPMRKSRSRRIGRAITSILKSKSLSLYH